jgi:hypothetical protein
MPVTITATVEQALAYSRQSTQGSIDYHRKHGRQELAKIRQNARMVARLATVLPQEATLEIAQPWHYEHPRVEFPREALVAVRKAVGRLHVEEKNLESAEERTIRITLSAEKYPGIRFQYVRPLAEGATCQIVEQTSTYKTLVCSVQ